DFFPPSPIIRRPLLTVCLGLIASFLVSSERSEANAAEPRRPPNIVLILADDEGYGELGCQGNPEIPTPHIDSIAKNGIRFTSGYVSAPMCSPSRAGLMTGRYQTRFGHEFNEDRGGRPFNPRLIGGKFGLPLTENTFADRMKALGYATCAIGKWHLGYDTEFRPTKRGFDEFYGTLGNTPFFHPKNLVDSRVSSEVQKVDDHTFYTTHAYAARAVDWIGRNKDRPFFLYLPFNAQHDPLEAPQNYLDRFPTITDAKRKLFAAMMAAKDDAVGQILDKVREIGQLENTLIFYLSDNGGPTALTTSKNNPLRGYKRLTLEGGIRVPFLVQWKGKLPRGKTYDHPIIQLDILPTAVAAAGARVDPAWKLDGVNLLPYLTGEDTGRPHETLYWRYGEQWAIRRGDWKLVAALPRSGNSLFNLAQDIGEANDRWTQEPERAKELRTLWEKWNVGQEEPLWK
ncbi:MAG: sulfatase family protein, partial [Opitutaceae bacterium]